MQVNVKLQSRTGTTAIGGDTGDDINIKVTSWDLEGNLVTDGTAEVKADGNSEYQFLVNAVEGGKIDVEVSGTQYLPLGAYFYAAYDEDGESENGESDLNPGQLEAQNFVGVAMGNTRIHANASKILEEIEKPERPEEPEEPKGEEPKEEPKEEEPKEEEPKEPVEIHVVEKQEKQELQKEEQKNLMTQPAKTWDDNDTGYGIGVLLVASCAVIGFYILKKRKRLE